MSEPCKENKYECLADSFPPPVPVSARLGNLNPAFHVTTEGVAEELDGGEVSVGLVFVDGVAERLNGGEVSVGLSFADCAALLSTISINVNSIG